MYEPTEEERRIIAEAEKRRAEMKKVPPSQRRYHPRPERFDFPIGLDDEGRPFPVHERGERSGEKSGGKSSEESGREDGEG